ncbi:hypothetical protein CLAFUR0_03756 [Fulvia fulva]|nr:hypothetical protein CLAFUR0_03756 [Fulvia fulva]
MDKSPLHRLPGELRNRIYRLALIQHDPVKLDSTGMNKFIDSGSKRNVKNALDLPSTRKQVREEGLSIFFAENRFEIKTDILNGDEKHVAKAMFSTRIAIGGWLLSLGDSARHIGKVTVVLSGWVAWHHSEDWVEAAVVRVMTELRFLFSGTCAAPEVHLRCNWSHAKRRKKDFFVNPVLALTFRDHSTARQALSQAFDDEEGLVRRSTPKLGEGSYGLIDADERKLQLQRTREMVGILTARMGRTFVS